MQTPPGKPLTLLLGPTFSSTLWDVRKHVTDMRRRRADEAVIVVELHAPITSPVVEVAILSGSLYLIGVRRQGGPWFEFQPDVARSHPGRPPAPARLRGSRWIMRGSRPALSSYRELGLVEAVERKEKQGYALTYRGTPTRLLAFFDTWDGTLNSDDQRLAMCLLIFTLCESLRFRSIENACARWIHLPGGLESTGEFVFTSAMIAAVQHWKRAALDDPDIWTRPPGQPDPIAD